MNAIKKFLRDEEGAAAVEYGLMVALIAVGIIGAVSALRRALCAEFNVVTVALGGTAAACT